MKMPDMSAPTESVPRDSYGFVMNVRGFADFDSFELAPGHILRRATETEVEEIRTVIENLGGPGHRHYAYAWEIQWSDNRRETEALPPESWKHFVVGFRG